MSLARRGLLAGLAALVGGCSPAQASQRHRAEPRLHARDRHRLWSAAAAEARSLHARDAARRRQGGDLLLRRLVGQRQQGRLPVRRPGPGLARHHHHHPRLSPLSRGALPDLPRGCRAGDALGGRSRRPAEALRHGPFGRRPYRADAGGQHALSRASRRRSHEDGRRDRPVRPVRFPAAQVGQADRHLRRRRTGPRSRPSPSPRRRCRRRC